MTALRCIPALILAALLAACVSTKVPIGIAGGPQTDDRLIGTWRGADPETPENKFVLFAFQRPNTKTVEVLLVAPPGTKDPGWATFEVTVGKAGQYTFLNARGLIENGEPSHDNTDGTYAPFVYRLDGDTIVLRALDYEKVRQATANSEIAGDGGTITAASPELDAYMADHAEALLGDKPTELHRER